MSKEKQKNQKEIDSMVDDFNRNRTPRKTGITKTEWERVKTIITAKKSFKRAPANYVTTNAIK